MILFCTGSYWTNIFLSLANSADTSSKFKKFTFSKIILLSGVSPKNLLPQSHKECISYFDIIFISDPGHEMEWKDFGAQNVICLPISAGCPNTFQKVAKNYNKRKKYDIVFIGRLDTGSNEYRIKILNFLLSSGEPFVSKNFLIFV